MKIIGLGHQARSGKTTVADYLAAQHGFRHYAFAELLKRSIHAVTSWGHQHANGSLKEIVDPAWGFSPRYTYQQVGVAYRKIMGQDVWAKALRLQIERDAAKTDQPDQFRAVISDLRFEKGEVEMVKDMGGKLWRVDRPGLPDLIVPPKTAIGRAVDHFTGRAKTWSHQSEYDLADFAGWDAIIKNDSTLEALYERAEQELHKVLNVIDGQEEQS